MGLRRGFLQGGAQNLLMTLWPISDEITVQIMSDFTMLRTAVGTLLLRRSASAAAHKINKNVNEAVQNRTS